MSNLESRAEIILDKETSFFAFHSLEAGHIKTTESVKRTIPSSFVLKMSCSKTAI